MEANRQSLHVEEVITETMSFLEREAKNRGVRLEADLPQDLPEIVSDRGELQQIFLNILGNALDAVATVERAGGPDNGRFIKVVCTALGPQGLEVAVSDNGKGMSPTCSGISLSPSIPLKKTRVRASACSSPTALYVAWAATSMWRVKRARAAPCG